MMVVCIVKYTVQCIPYGISFIRDQINRSRSLLTSMFVFFNFLVSLSKYAGKLCKQYIEIEKAKIYIEIIEFKLEQCPIQSILHELNCVVFTGHLIVHTYTDM